MANPAIIVEFLAETSKLVAGVKDVEKSGEKANSALGNVNWRSVAKWGAVTAAAAGTAKLLKDSSDATVDLAKATAQLQRATNLDARTASAWVEVLKVRNISIDSFQTSLLRTSKLMDKSRLAQEQLAKVSKDYADVAAQLDPIIAKGGEAGKDAAKELDKWGKMVQKAQTAADKANAPFERLNVNLADVKAGRINKVLLQAADGLAKIRNPASRAALAVQLFGRQGLKLLPILLKGSKGIQEQLDLAEKYNTTIGDKTVKNVAKLADEQRQLQMAQDGVKTSIGQALIPAQVSLYGTLLDVISVVLPLTKNVDVMKGVLIAAAVAWGIYKVAVIASTVASLGLNAAMLPQIAIAAAIVVGIAALIAIGVLLYKNWDKIAAAATRVWGAIKRGAQSTLAWLRSNWPLLVGILLGPFALAIVLLIRNWDKITEGAKAALNAVRNAFASLVNWLGGIIGSIAAQVSRLVAIFAQLDNPVIAAVGRIRAAIVALPAALGRLAGPLAAVGHALAAALKAPINTVIALWNKLKLPSFKIKIPGPLPDIKFPGFGFPNLALLAKGGIVTGPTLAMLGERGPEAVIPLGAGGAGPIEVRVFIGDQELRGMVSAEVRDQNNRVAQTLLAGRYGAGRLG